MAHSGPHIDWLLHPGIKGLKRNCRAKCNRVLCNLLALVYVVVQFYPWFKFYILLFLGIVMYDNEFECVCGCMYVVVQFYPWFKSSFLFFLGIVMYDNEFETKEKKI